MYIYFKEYFILKKNLISKKIIFYHLFLKILINDYLKENFEILNNYYYFIHFFPNYCIYYSNYFYFQYFSSKIVSFSVKICTKL